MVATPILAQDIPTAADGPPKQESTSAAPQPAFSIDFPKTEENGDTEEFLVAKHIDQMFQVQATSVEAAMAKVLQEEWGDGVVQLAEHVTVDCDSTLNVEDYGNGNGNGEDVEDD